MQSQQGLIPKYTVVNVEYMKIMTAIFNIDYTSYSITQTTLY
jgi:hypothetical protein